MKRVSLGVLVLGFVGGVALYSLVDLGMWFIVFLFFLAAVTYYLPPGGTPVSMMRSSVPLILILCAFGAARFTVAQIYNQPSHELQEHISEQVVLDGVVVEEPDERESHVKLTVAVTSPTDVSDTDRVLVLAPLYPTFEYGDRISMHGELDVPKNFTSESSGKEFNYKMYLEKSGIHFLLFFPEITLVEKGQGAYIKEKLFDVKGVFLESIGTTIHEPYAALLGGLVVGAKRSLGDELLEMFRITGLIHIVVLSGYNVTIVAESLMRFFSFLPRLATLILGGGSIVLFAIMTGGSATVVRASIMALLIVIGRALGRVSELPRLLMIALFFMVLHNPYIVLYDPSFQLSFIAMLGLIYLAPLLEERFTRITDRFGLRSVAAATIATQIAVLPLLLYLMGDISLVALPVNLMVLIFIPVTMFFGFVTGVLGMVNSFLAMPAAILTFILLYYEISVVKLFAAIPYASVTVKHFPLWLLVLFYGAYVLAYTLYVKHKKSPMYGHSN